MKFLWLLRADKPCVTLLHDLIICSCLKWYSLQSLKVILADLPFNYFFFKGLIIDAIDILKKITQPVKGKKLINMASIFFFTSGKVRLFGQGRQSSLLLVGILVLLVKALSFDVLWVKDKVSN